MFAHIERKELSYAALSYGRIKSSTCDCTLSHVRARHVNWNGRKTPVLAIELTGDRFLRRMVRILVASALVLAAQQDESFDAEALVKLVEAEDRTLPTRPAPPQGLIFVTASYPV